MPDSSLGKFELEFSVVQKHKRKDYCYRGDRICVLKVGSCSEKLKACKFVGNWCNVNVQMLFGGMDSARGISDARKPHKLTSRDQQACFSHVKARDSASKDVGMLR